jgi:hypothetical protein
MDSKPEKQKKSVWFYFGSATQVLMWVLIFILLFITVTAGFDFSEFRYVGF